MLMPFQQQQSYIMNQVACHRAAVMSQQSAVALSNNCPITTELKHENALGDIKSIRISQGEKAKPDVKAEEVCNPGIHMEDVADIGADELVFSFKVVLRNIIRFRDKLRSQGENVVHVSQDNRTKAAYAVFIELRKAAFKVGIQLKTSF